MDPETQTFTIAYESDLDIAGDSPEGTTYPVKIVAELGDQVAFDEFELTFKNPCLDEEVFNVIPGKQSVPDFTYTLFNDDNNTWTQPPFDVQVDPEILTLCGGLSYSLPELGPLADFVTWDPFTGATMIYAEDLSLVGEHPYTFSSFLDEYPEHGVAEETGTITIVDPCLSPSEITGEGDNEVISEYGYDMTFAPPMLSVDPQICLEQAMWECTYLGGPYTGDLDLCGFELVTVDDETLEELFSSGSFDPETGAFEFVTEDVVLFPEGDYEFEIKVMIGDQEYISPYTVLLVNPCRFRKPTIDKDPFTDGPFIYMLRDDPFTLPYEMATIVGSTNSKFACGEKMIEFVTEAGEPAPMIFSHSADDEELVIFGRETEMVGEYNMRFRYFFDSQPDNYAESETFQVLVKDLCLPGDDSFVLPKLVAPLMDDQVYTISAEPLYYDIPIFSTEPVFCAEEIAYSLADITVEGDIGAAIKFEGTQFSIHFEDSLDLAGVSLEGETYSVTVKAKLGDQDAESTFNLTVLNPCLNRDFFDLNTSDDATDGDYSSFTYTLYNDTENSWQGRDPFTATTQNENLNDLCGEIKHTVSAGPLDGFITYDPETGMYTIYSEDRSLVGVHPMTMLAELDNYSADKGYDTVAKLESTLTILDPCDKPFFIGTQEMEPTYSDYSGATTMTPPEITILPTVCMEELTFSCAYISGPYEGD
jgi:hypothetical protein